MVGAEEGTVSHAPDPETAAYFQQALRPPHPSCFCPPLSPPSELVQGVAMSTAAVTPFRSFVQTPIFSVSPSSSSSSLRALVSSDYSNDKHHHHHHQQQPSSCCARHHHRAIHFSPLPCSDLGQGVAISTTAFMLPRFFVQTHIFSVSPSSFSL